jgi:vacuolar-type H+-ATPase subunit I/STV1
MDRNNKISLEDLDEDKLLEGLKSGQISIEPYLLDWGESNSKYAFYHYRFYELVNKIVKSARKIKEIKENEQDPKKKKEKLQRQINKLIEISDELIEKSERVFELIKKNKFYTKFFTFVYPLSRLTINKQNDNTN